MEISIAKLKHGLVLFNKFGDFFKVEEKTTEECPRWIERASNFVFCPLRSAWGYKMIGVFPIQKNGLIDLGGFLTEDPKNPKTKIPVKTTFFKETTDDVAA